LKTRVLISKVRKEWRADADNVIKQLGPGNDELSFGNRTLIRDDHEIKKCVETTTRCSGSYFHADASSKTRTRV
jgi:hypothetical protein